MSSQWFINHSGKIVGPISSSQLKQLASTSKIDQSTRVRLGEGGTWTTAAKVKGLFNDQVEPIVLAGATPGGRVKRKIDLAS